MVLHIHPAIYLSTSCLNTNNMAALIYAGFFLAALVAASTTTPSVTSTTKPCVDKRNNCQKIKNIHKNACVNYVMWAIKNCRKTCGLCRASVKDCVDEDDAGEKYMYTYVSYDDKHRKCCPDQDLGLFWAGVVGCVLFLIIVVVWVWCICSCLKSCCAKMTAPKTRNTDMTTTTTATTTVVDDVPVIENGSDGGKLTASVGGLHVSEEEKPASVNVDVGKKPDLRVSGSDVPVIENGSDGGKPTASVGGLHVSEEEKPASLTVDVGKRKGDIRVSGSGTPMVMTANTSPGVYPAYGEPHPLGQPLPMAPYLGIPPPYPGPTPPAPDEEEPPPAYSTLN